MNPELPESHFGASEFGETRAADLDFDPAPGGVGVSQKPLFRAEVESGMAFDAAGRPTALWPQELLLRLREVVEEEAGGAWKRVWKECGRAWGRRVMDDLDKRCAEVMGCAFEDLELERFVEFLVAQVTAEGWGRFTVDLTEVSERGLILATLRHSVFDGKDGGAGDVMLAGMLASMMGRLSGEDLDCVRLPVADGGSRFVVTARERVECVERRIEAGEDPGRILETV